MLKFLKIPNMLDFILETFVSNWIWTFHSADRSVWHCLTIRVSGLTQRVQSKSCTVKTLPGLNISLSVIYEQTVMWHNKTDLPRLSRRPKRCWIVGFMQRMRPYAETNDRLPAQHTSFTLKKHEIWDDRSSSSHEASNTPGLHFCIFTTKNRQPSCDWSSSFSFFFFFSSRCASKKPVISPISCRPFILTAQAGIGNALAGLQTGWQTLELSH